MKDLITMNEQCWHYKLIKFVWGFNPKEFHNLCPYFWTTIASVFVFPFICIWKILKFIVIGFIDIFVNISCKITDWLDSKEYSERLLTISPIDAYFLNHINDSENELIKKSL